MKAIAFILTFTAIAPSTSSAQDLKTYTGPISSNYGAQVGSGTYTYYEDLKTHERTKHGTFTFKDQQKNEIRGTYSKMISGNFKSGSKNGTWTYKITYTDYDRVEDITDMKFMATGEVLLTASYKDGMPNGDWLYSNKTKARRASKNIYGEIVYSAFVPAIDMTIKLRYNMGVLTGAFSSQFGQKKLSGTFDAQGRLDKTSTSTTAAQEEVTTYLNGVVLERYVKRNTGEIIEREEFDKSLVANFLQGSVNEKGLDKHNIKEISHRNIFKEKVINLWTTIYNNNDFLHAMTGGDKTIIPDNYGGIASLKIIGGDFVRLKVKEYSKVTELYDFKSAQEAIKNEKYEVAIKLYNDILENNKNGAYFISNSDVQIVNKRINEAVELEKHLDANLKADENERKRLYTALTELLALHDQSSKRIGSEALNQFLSRTGEKARLCGDCKQEMIFGDIDGNGIEDILIQYVLEPTKAQEEENGRSAIYDNDKLLAIFLKENNNELRVENAMVINTSEIVDYSVYGSTTIKQIKDKKIYFEKVDRDEENRSYKEMVWSEYGYQSGTQKGLRRAQKSN